MAMASQEVKKRKACNACMKAKAKCSSLGSRADICDRCERLSKECIYGDSLRKRGPRTRSRMKQLEQRVESLMGMLSANVQPPQKLQQPNILFTAVGTTARSTEEPDQPQSNEASQPYITPENSTSGAPSNAFAAYDPVETGLLGIHEATVLLDEFRQEFSQFFPFVVVDSSVEIDDFRHQHPFLFLSIMAVMVYTTLSTQRALTEEFRDQIALRITRCSLKGLEALQGLLIHAAYCHFFYKPQKQQLPLIVQMCVATAQDLGLGGKCRVRDVTASPPALSPAEDRALLGTYYIAAVFAQAWRKRTTVSYTRAIARACQSFSQRPEYPSDLLISPLVHSGELMCRINDYFSYDNIEDSEVNGETILELSTSNFHTELQRFRDGLPESIRRNVTLRLAGDIIDIMIHDCSFHGNLWQSSSSTSSMTMSQTRMCMLQRSLVASQSFTSTLLETPSSSLHHLAFPAWSGWFYSTMLVVKMVILRQTGSTGNLRVSSVPHAVSDFLPREFGGSVTHEICQMTATLSQNSLREGATIVEQAELVFILESLIKKLEAVTPRSEDVDSAFADKPFLNKVVTLQTGLLSSVKKITEKQSKTSTTPVTTNSSVAQAGDSGFSSMYEPLTRPDYHQNQQPCSALHHNPQADQMHSIEPLNFTYFDGFTSFGTESMQQPPFDDWLWNMAMNDSNMFTL